MLITPTLANEDALIAIPLMFIIFSSVTLMVCITSYNRRKSDEAKAREETKREVAAYVAEGTMTSDDAARILSEGRRGSMPRVAVAAASAAQEVPNAWKEWIERTSHKARAAAAAFRQTPANGTPPGPGWQWVGDRRA
jgi:hypothetical protein